MIHVSLPQFEGPLGLLLYLIRKEEMDIYNIPIYNITSQYLEHLKKMKELDLEVAGEFVAMAATLIHIKSRMLLPQYNENGEIIENTEDPRKELVQKLLEYQKYQEASKTLNERALLGRDVWARGLREELPVDEGDIIVDEGGLFALISMYRKVVKQMKKNVHNVRAKGQSIAARILEIRDRLLPGQRVTLKELIAPVEWSANKLLITFLSLLELTKMGFTNIFQNETYGDIYVDTKKPVERDVIERVEEYDKQPGQAEAFALALEAEVAASQVNANVDVAQEELAILQDETLEVENEKSEQLDLVATEDLASDDDILAAERELGLVETEVATEVEPEVATEVVANAEPQTQTLENLAEDFELAWAKFAEGTEENEVANVTAPETAIEPVATNEKPRDVLSLVADAKSFLDAFDEASDGPQQAAEVSVAEVIADEDEEFMILTGTPEIDKDKI